MRLTSAAPRIFECNQGAIAAFEWAFSYDETTRHASADDHDDERAGKTGGERNGAAHCECQPRVRKRRGARADVANGKLVQPNKHKRRENHGYERSNGDTPKERMHLRLTRIYGMVCGEDVHVTCGSAQRKADR